MSAPEKDKLLDLLNQSRQYLMQQEELFGELALDGVKPASKRKGAPSKKDGETAAGRTAAIPAAPGIVDGPGPRTQAPSGETAQPGDSGSGSPFPYPDEPWVSAASLDELNGIICNCLKCGLGKTRTKFVFGVGDPNADVMFVGEGPGADEDAQGEPFVGRAGQLLNKIIEATGMKRQQVYICNIVKCRPPNNRAPLPDEEESCTPYLMKQIELVKPKFIVCLGRTAAQWLLRTADGLSALRGRMHDFHGAKLIVTYHPAALLRNPEWKKPTWEDMKMLMSAYEATRGK